MHAFHRYSYPAVRMYLQVMRPRRVRGLPRIIEIIFGGAPPRQKYLSRRERAPISAHTDGSALNAAPVTIGFSRGTVGTKTAQPFSARKIEKVPKTQKVFGTGINFILRCHPNWLAAHSFRAITRPAL